MIIFEPPIFGGNPRVSWQGDQDDQDDHTRARKPVFLPKLLPPLLTFPDNSLTSRESGELRQQASRRAKSRPPRIASAWRCLVTWVAYLHRNCREFRGKPGCLHPGCQMAMHFLRAIFRSSGSTPPLGPILKRSEGRSNSQEHNENMLPHRVGTGHKKDPALSEAGSRGARPAPCRGRSHAPAAWRTAQGGRGCKRDIDREVGRRPPSGRRNCCRRAARLAFRGAHCFAPRKATIALQQRDVSQTDLRPAPGDRPQLCQMKSDVSIVFAVVEFWTWITRSAPAWYPAIPFASTITNVWPCRSPVLAVKATA